MNELAGRVHTTSMNVLDESLTNNPGVLIANCLAGPLDCIASNSCFSAFCLNECKELLNEVEGHVGGPSATTLQHMD